jgi:HAD superfamily hydrolase (TIGR01509 family)
VIPRFPVYLFDVDGTLLDSAGDICAAVEETLAGTDARPLPQGYFRRYIGHHLREMYADVLPHYSAEQVDELIRTYRRIYPERGHRLTRIYDGVADLLERLPGLKSTATTKNSEMTQRVLTQFGLVGFFDHVQGTDGFPAKPEPDVILKSIEKFGVRPEDCLLVGDAAPDMEAGRRAGVRTCAVTWGYGDHEEMARHRPDYWIGSPAELLFWAGDPAYAEPT